MKLILSILTIALLSGCATWGGIKKDTSDGVEWTKEKVNKGAEYVKEKTE
jgi:predicted small secreted protein